MVVLLRAHSLSPDHNPQDGREFKTTCLVDEEEMKKLLRERGHMLENHVERLWAYLTIQELLAKRYDPCGCQAGTVHTRVPLTLRFTVLLCSLS